MRPKCPRSQSLAPSPPHLSGHMVADGYDGCVAQLQDSEHLTAHDSQRPTGNKSCTPQHILQDTLGHCQGQHGKTVREGGGWGWQDGRR